MSISSVDRSGPSFAGSDPSGSVLANVGQAFEQTLTRLTRRLLTVAGLCGLAWGFFSALCLALVGVWMDLVWDLSPVFRIEILIAAVGIGIGLLVGILIGAARTTRRALVIRRLDQTAATGGEIVTGYELQASAGSATTTLSSGLAEMAVRKAVGIATTVSSASVVPSKPAVSAAMTVMGAIVFTLLMAVVAPALAQTEWMRFMDPFGDHPPYSETQFAVEPGDTRVRYGDGFDVIATVTGPQVDNLELVLRSNTGGKSNVAAQVHEEMLPMFFDVAGHWKATVSSVTSPVEYFVRSRSTRSQRFKVDVITVPEIGNVRFRITPPEYTRDAAYEGPLPQGGLSALAGTVIEVRATSNRPLQKGVVEVVSGTQHELVSLEPATLDGESHEVSGHWTVSDGGQFHLKVTDVAGQESRDSFSGTINLLHDQIPLVRIVEPVQQSMATPSVTVPVAISAEDDYGVTRLQLFRSLNDSRATPMNFEIPSPPMRRLEQTLNLPLSSYGLQPGDVIKLFARVEDNDPAGAKGSESAVVVIQIISEEDLQRMVQAREGMEMLISKYQQAQRRLEAAVEEIEQMRKQLEKRDADGTLSDEERDQLTKLSERLEEEANALNESAKHLLPNDLDKALNKELKSLAKRMQDAADKTGQMAGSKPTAGQAGQQLSEIQEQLEQEKRELKKGVNDPLETFSEIYPLLEDQYRFVELYYRQRDLADRLSSLKDENNPDDPAIKTRMRSLETEQRKIREDLENLLNDIETHAQRLPTDDERLKKLADSCLEFVEAVRNSDVSGAMSDAELGLAEFSGEQGYAESKDAADMLEKFLSRCRGNGQACEGACEDLKFQPGEGAMGDTLNQLLAGSGFKPGMMGQNPGQGGPSGSGGGFSSRRGAMDQIGLYGNIPTRGNPTSAKGGSKPGGKSIGGSFKTDSTKVTSGRLDPHGLLRSSGTSETAIPARYRGRVQDYFQRIAEEAGFQKDR